MAKTLGNLLDLLNECLDSWGSDVYLGKLMSPDGKETIAVLLVKNERIARNLVDVIEEGFFAIEKKLNAQKRSRNA